MQTVRRGTHVSIARSLRAPSGKRSWGKARSLTAWRKERSEGRVACVTHSPMGRGRRGCRLFILYFYFYLSLLSVRGLQAATPPAFLVSPRRPCTHQMHQCEGHACLLKSDSAPRRQVDWSSSTDVLGLGHSSLRMARRVPNERPRRMKKKRCGGKRGKARSWWGKKKWVSVTVEGWWRTKNTTYILYTPIINTHHTPV